MRGVTVKSGCLSLSDTCWRIAAQSGREKQGAHCVYRVWKEEWLCMGAFNGCPTVSGESESCRHRAQHNTDRAEWDFLWLLGDWIKPSSFATYHVLLHGFRQFLIFHPWSWQCAFYIPPISSTFQLALSSSMSWWCFFPHSEFLPFCFQAENQIYKSKAMGERHGDWRAFKSFQSSQSFRERNKQEIKMELEMVAIPLFRGLKPGAFLNTSSCFIFCSAGNVSSSPLLISLKKEGNYRLWEMPKIHYWFFLLNCFQDFLCILSHQKKKKLSSLMCKKSSSAKVLLNCIPYGLSLSPECHQVEHPTTGPLAVCFTEILLLNKNAGWPSDWTSFA